MTPNRVRTTTAGYSSLITALLLLLQIITMAVPYLADPASGGNGSGSRGGRGDTIYVDDDAEPAGDGSPEHPFKTISEALKNASSGDTIRVLEGIYRENVLINRTLNLEGNGPEETVITSGIGDVVNVKASWVNISGFRITGGGWGAGIKLSSDHNTITNNYVTNKNYGIHLLEATSNTITNNNCSGNNQGIFIQDSSWNTISSNEMYDNSNFGIFAFDGILGDNRILDNNVINGMYPKFYYDEHGTPGDPITIRDLQDTEEDASLTNLGFILLYNCSYFELERISIHNSSGGIKVYRSDHIDILSCNISVLDSGLELGVVGQSLIADNIVNNGNTGIRLNEVGNSVIRDNQCNWNRYGIWVENGNDNLISENDCIGNDQTGIRLTDNSIGNFIDGNNCTGNAFHGISIQGSNENDISANNCSSCSFSIYIYQGSMNNTLSGNDCSESYEGIHVTMNSPGNELVDNDCNDNREFGIILESESHSTILSGNDCNNNTFGLMIHDSSNNTISENICSMNNGSGMYLEGSHGNEIVNNTCSWNNDTGLYLKESGNNLISNNTFEGNGNFGIFLHDGKLLNNIITNDNMINGRFSNYYFFTQGTEEEPVVINDLQDSLVDSNSTNLGFLILYACAYVILTNITILFSEQGILVDSSTNITISSSFFRDAHTAISVDKSNSVTINDTEHINNTYGISLDDSSDCLIEDNSCELNQYGISLSSCDSCVIADNYCRNNNVSGIQVSDQSMDNMILNNTAEGNTHGIVVMDSTGNNISSNLCNASSVGIQITSDCTDSNIADNQCWDNDHGILLENSTGNRILNNTCMDNEFHGIYVTNGSSSNSISLNNASGNGYSGIYILNSDDNDLHSNTCEENLHGIHFENAAFNILASNSISDNTDFGLFFSESLQDNLIFRNNTINGLQPISYYYEAGTEQDPFVIRDISDSTRGESYAGMINLGMVILYDCDFCLLENISISHADSGIFIYRSRNITVTDVAVKDINNGIHVWNSTFVDIIDNTFTDLLGNGITITGSNDCLADDNTIEESSSAIVSRESRDIMIVNNTCRWNTIGIEVRGSFNCSLEKNICSFESENGIYVDESSDGIVITNNTCSDNNANGIIIKNSIHCVISGNTCLRNRDAGVRLDSRVVNSTVGENDCNENNYGIMLYIFCQNNTIFNNECSRNQYYGIYLYFYCEYITVRNNTCLENTYAGIAVSSSNKNIIINNTSSKNQHGVSLASSYWNSMKNNTLDDNEEFGIYLAGEALNENMISHTNTINGKHPHSYENQAGTENDTIVLENILDSPEDVKMINLAFIILYNCSYFDIRNATITEMETGIYLENCLNITISTSLIGWRTTGIIMTESENCTLETSDLIASETGIIFIDSFNNTIDSCEIVGNDIGVIYEWSQGNSLLNSNVSSNTIGVHLYISGNTTVTSNTINGNDETGILIESAFTIGESGTKLYSSAWNNIHNNTLDENGDFGIQMIAASYNNIENNTIDDSETGINVTLIKRVVVQGDDVIIYYYHSKGNQACYNNITDSKTMGVDCSWNGGNKIIATYCWWGDASGPYHEYENPQGQGETITDYVDFLPWIGKPKTVYNTRLGEFYYLIQDAIDAAIEGDTIRIHSATYLEDIVVNRPLTIIGNGTGDTIIHAKAPYRYFPVGCPQVVKLASDGVEIRDLSVIGNGDSATGIKVIAKNCKISNIISTDHAMGIILENGTDTIVKESILRNNSHSGIALYHSTGNLIMNNSIESLEKYGIYLTSSHLNSMWGNHISNHDEGVRLQYSRNNSIFGNLIHDNVHGFSLYNADGNFIESNNVRDNDWTALLLELSEYNILTGNTCSGNPVGIFLVEYSLHNKIENNTCLGNDIGIHLMRSPENEVIRNTCPGNGVGIFVDEGNDCLIDLNTCYDNDVGIDLRFADRATISGNNCSNNTEVGLYAAYVRYSDIIFNDVGPDNNVGVLMNNSKDTIITNNTILGNGIGIQYINGRQDSSARYNNIAGNTIGVDASDNDGNNVQAYYGYWGDETGPYHPTLNPDGEGDEITDFVGFQPFSTHSLIFAVIEEISPSPALDTENVTFRGRGMSYDSLIVRYVWTSSINDEIYNGTGTEFIVSDLTNGTHEIYFRVQDDRGFWSSYSHYTLIVNGKPRLDLSPLPDWILEGENVHLRANVWDDGEVVRYVWTSSREGLLYDGSNTEFVWYGPTWGDRIIYCQIQDDLGAWSDVAKSPLGVYTKPIAHIDSITPEDAFQGQSITFEGHGTDFLGVTRYVWKTSVGDRVLSNTPVFQYSGLTNGTHIISFRVMNTKDLWSDWVNHTIVINGVPVAEIESITPNPASEGDTVEFKGRGSDDVRIKRYRWISDIDGEIYNGTEKVYSAHSLSFGTHTISLTVQDDQGVWSQPVTAFLNFTMKPYAIIESIQPTPAFIFDTIHFTGSATDDGIILIYLWRSDFDGIIYNGTEATFNTTTMTPGIHTIYLSVMDNMGVWSDEVYSIIEVMNNTRPEIIILGPGDGSRVNDTVTIHGTTWDDKKVIRIEYAREGTGEWKILKATDTGLDQWTMEWDSRKVSNGNETLVFRAYDGTVYSDLVTLNLTVENEKEPDVLTPDEEEESFLERMSWIGVVFIVVLAFAGYGYVIWHSKKTSISKKNLEAWPDQQVPVSGSGKVEQEKAGLKEGGGIGKEKKLTGKEKKKKEIEDKVARKAEKLRKEKKVSENNGTVIGNGVSKESTLNGFEQEKEQMGNDLKKDTPFSPDHIQKPIESREDQSFSAEGGKAPGDAQEETDNVGKVGKGADTIGETE